MSKIFFHALEGAPEDPVNFTGQTERDIRVRWLVTDDSPGAKVGSGPWKVSSSTADGIVLIPSDSKIKPNFLDQVHFCFIPDGDILAEALTNGKVDFAILTDPKTIAYFRAHPDKFTVWSQVNNLNIFYLGFYWDKPPFQNNINLRKALACAINTGGVGFGTGAADPAVGPVPPGMNGYDPGTYHQPPCSPERAKEYYAQSNPRPTRLTLVYNNAHTFSELLAGLVRDGIQTNLKLNVDMNPVTDWNALVTAVKQEMGDMFIYSWHQRNPHNNDPHDFLWNLFYSKSSANLTKYRNPQFDNALDRGDYGLAQYLILGKDKNRIEGDQPMVFLAHWKRTAVWNKRVKHLEEEMGDGCLPKRKLVDVDKQ